jgi:LysM repeat protein
VDSAPACPFVAFEDDREARATSPDHRHRCYAELVPSPRASAHQEAYCLSSAFPVCPTFQDWARREAAHARGDGERPRAAPMAQPEADARAIASGVDDTDRDAGREDDEDGRPARHPSPPIADPPIRRNPPRDWAAPPPWAAGGAGSTGSAAAPRRSAAGGDRSRTPEFLAGRADESRGLAGSAADRLVGPVPDPDLARSPYDAHAVSGPDDELAGLVTGRRTPARPAHDYAPPSRGHRPSVSSTRTARDRERERERDAIAGPSWERARRFEAYPTIRARTGLPAPPRLAVLAGALVIAALALFFIPPIFLGIGGGGGNGATPDPSASQAVPSTSVEPTAPPAPTAQVYLIKAGDTVSGIATEFGVTPDELLAANPQITDPDKITIGDEITIPARPPTEFTEPSTEPSVEPS